MRNDTQNTFAEFLDTPEKRKHTAVDRTTEIVRSGDAIVVPDRYTYKAAADALLLRAQQEEQAMVRVERYACHPNDGAVHLTRLITQTFGFAKAAGTESMFGDTPPQTLRVQTGPNVEDYEEAIVDGTLGFPMLPDVKITVGGDVEEMAFVVRIEAKEKHRVHVNAFLDELHRRIDAHSIYQGKAFDSSFSFLRFDGAQEDGLILPASTAAQVRANLFTPLAYRHRLKDVGTPFGRTVLLEGPYGTGKTLAAFIAGAKAIANGITFLYVRTEDAQGGRLPVILKYARQYAPAVLFVEDIDLVAGESDAERDQSLNLLLNTLDGIDSKGGKAEDVMLVLTTNDVGSINEALMRAGRIDAVIHVGLPDADAAARLLVLYGHGQTSEDFDATHAGAQCAGMTPAFIREIVERSKLMALSRDPDAPLRITTADVILAAEAIGDHLRLATPRQAVQSVGDRLAESLHDAVRGSVDGMTLTKLDGQAIGHVVE